MKYNTLEAQLKLYYRHTRGEIDTHTLEAQLKLGYRHTSDGIGVLARGALVTVGSSPKHIHVMRRYNEYTRKCHRTNEHIDTCIPHVILPLSHQHAL